MRWDDVGQWRAGDLVRALRAYVDGDYPLYPEDDPRLRALHEFLYREQPDPRGLLPLFGPPPALEEADDARLRRDVVAVAVVTSFIRRIAVDPQDKDRVALYDVIAEAGVYSAFDRAYGDAHPKLTEDVTEFFGEPRFLACDESRAALRKVLPRLVAQWRERVTSKGSSTFFGIVLRHLEGEGQEVLVAEWAHMREAERYDLLKRLAGEDALAPAARVGAVAALADPSLDVKEAALEALEAHGAPVGELDASAREADFERALPRLRKWTETGS